MAREQVIRFIRPCRTVCYTSAQRLGPGDFAEREKRVWHQPLLAAGFSVSVLSSPSFDMIRCLSLLLLLTRLHASSRFDS